MNLLLDTHTLIWYLEGNRELSQTCQSLIEERSNTNFVSIASFWEIAIKLSIGGKLELSKPFEQLNQLFGKTTLRYYLFASIIPLLSSPCLFITKILLIGLLLHKQLLMVCPYLTGMVILMPTPSDGFGDHSD